MRPADAPPAIGHPDYEKLQSLRDVFAREEMRIVGSPSARATTETGVLLGMRTGAVLMERAGDADGVDIDWKEARPYAELEPTAFTHNHPIPGSFSADDVGWALKARVAEVRAVDELNSHSIRFKTTRPRARTVYIDARQRIKRVTQDYGPPNSHAWRDELHRIWLFLARRYDLRYDRFEAPGEPPLGS